MGSIPEVLFINKDNAAVTNGCNQEQFAPCVYSPRHSAITPARSIDIVSNSIIIVMEADMKKPAGSLRRVHQAKHAPAGSAAAGHRHVVALDRPGIDLPRAADALRRVLDHLLP